MYCNVHFLKYKSIFKKINVQKKKKSHFFPHQKLKNILIIPVDNVSDNRNNRKRTVITIKNLYFWIMGYRIPCTECSYKSTNHSVILSASQYLHPQSFSQQSLRLSSSHHLSITQPLYQFINLLYHVFTQMKQQIYSFIHESVTGIVFVTPIEHRIPIKNLPIIDTEGTEQIP